MEASRMHPFCGPSRHFHVFADRDQFWMAWGNRHEQGDEDHPDRLTFRSINGYRPALILRSSDPARSHHASEGVEEGFR